MHEREVEIRLIKLESHITALESQVTALESHVTALESTKPDGYDAKLVKSKNSSKNDDETEG